MSSIWMFLRIHYGDVDGNGAMGPHRTNLLEAIDRFGSISAAAPAVDLTYRQAWRVVQVLNSQFDKPLIEGRRGGRSGGAFLTPLGKGVLARIREIERAASEALEPHFREFEKLTGMDPNKPPHIPRYLQIIDPSTIPPATKKPARRLKAGQKMKKQKVKKRPVRKKPAKSSRSARRR